MQWVVDFITISYYFHDYETKSDNVVPRCCFVSSIFQKARDLLRLTGLSRNRTWNRLEWDQKLKKIMVLVPTPEKQFISCLSCLCDVPWANWAKGSIASRCMLLLQLDSHSARKNRYSKWKSLTITAFFDILRQEFTTVHMSRRWVIPNRPKYVVVCIATAGVVYSSHLWDVKSHEAQICVDSCGITAPCCVLMF